MLVDGVTSVRKCLYQNARVFAYFRVWGPGCSYYEQRKPKIELVISTLKEMDISLLEQSDGSPINSERLDHETRKGYGSLVRFSDPSWWKYPVAPERITNSLDALAVYMQLIHKLMDGNPSGPRAAVEFYNMCAGSGADLPSADGLMRELDLQRFDADLSYRKRFLAACDAFFEGGLLYQDLRKIFLKS